MNQSELINAISSHHANHGVSKTSIKWVLEAQGEIAQAELKACGDVTLLGIGRLSVKPSAARTGRNPATGEAIQIAAKNKPHFAANQALKDAVNGN